VIAKNAIWNTIGMTVYLACQWLISFIVVWLYGNFTNAGYLTLAISITSFFYFIASYNIRAYQVSDFKAEYSDTDYIVARVITCVVSVALCAVLLLIIGYPALQTGIVLAYMIFRMNEAFIDVLHGIDQKHWRMDYIGVSFIARGILMLAAFALLGWMYNLLTAIIGMIVVTSLVSFLYDLPKVKTLAILSPGSTKNTISLLRKCFPLMLVGIISVAIPTYTRYSLERLHGTEDFGAYATVNTPTMIVLVAATLIFTPLINVFASSLKEMNYKRFTGVFVKCGMSIIGIVTISYVGALTLGEWGLTLVFGESIRSHAYILSGAVIATGLTAILTYMNTIFSTIRDLKGIIYGNIIGVLICIAVTDVFLIEYGLEGANYIMILSQAVAVLFLLIRFIHTTRKKWKS